MYKKLFFSTVTLLFLIVPGSAFAKDVLDDVNVKLSPTTPSADEDVTISINAYTMDLDASKIIWYVDKEAQKSGIGVTSIKVHTGDFGKKILVEVVIFTPDGRKINKEIPIAPSEVDVLWEAQTYTPPFYRGKTLPTYKSLVRMTAIPRFNTLQSDPSQFYYVWKYNRTLGVGKGLGKNNAVIQVGYAGTPVPVSVTVNLPGTDWAGNKNTTITPTQAAVRFYTQEPLLGTQFSHALGTSYAAAGSRVSLRAVPYFFSTDDYKNGNLLYVWKVGNNDAIPENDPTIMTISKKDSDFESSLVQLNIGSPKHILQRGRAATMITLPKEQQ